MAIKTIDTRILNKADFLSNWQNSEIELLPGEIGFVRVIDQKTNETTGEILHVPAILMKVGEADENGNPKAFNELPWLSAKASDVYDWAKKPEKPTYTLEELGAEAVGTSEAHNSDILAHGDIRALIEALSERLDNLTDNSTTTGGISAQSDWNETDETSLAYIKNKPFYSKGWSIEWDGTPTEEFIDVTDTMGAVIYKVGEAKTKEDLIGATCKYILNETEEVTFTIAKDNIVGVLDENGNETDKCFIIFDGYLGIFCVCLEPGTYYYSGLEFTFESTATFFVKASNYTPIYLGNTEIKKIDKNLIPDIFVKSDLVGVADGVASLNSEGKVPLEQLPNNIGSGGVTSWNDLTDRPFYETGYQIEWDLNLSNESVIFDGSDGYYKVSDIVLTKEQLVGATLKAVNDKESVDIVLSDRDIIDYSDSCYGMANTPFFVVTTQATEFELMGMTLSFNSAGVWFIHSSGLTWTYYLGKGEIKQIDKKFIPSDISTWEALPDKPFSESKSSITWDGMPTSEFVNVDGLDFYKVSDTYIEAKSLIGSTVSLSGIEIGDTITEVISSDSITDLGENCFYISSAELDEMPAIVITSSAISVDGIGFPSSGIWFMSIPDVAYTSCLESIQIKKLDPKFIPNYFGETGTKITWDGKPTGTFVQPGKIIEWDGTDTGVSLTIPSDGENIPEGAALYKVAEKLDSLEGWSYLVTYSDGSSDSEFLNADNIGSVLDDNGDIIATYGASDTMWVWNVEQSAPVPIMGMEVTFPEPGLYFINLEGQLRVSTIYDEVYDSMGPMCWYKISEPLNGTLAGGRANMTADGETVEIIFAEGDTDLHIPAVTLPSGSSYVPPYVVNIVADNEILDFTDMLGCSLTFPKAGLYLIDFNSIGEGVTFNYLVSSDYEIVKIDKKFLPEDISGGGMDNYIGQAFSLEIENIDLLLMNYTKALSASSSIEEMCANLGYGDITAKEFILQITGGGGSGKISTKFDSIRIGIASYVTSLESADGYDYKICVELNKITELDTDDNSYTFYCLQNPDNPNEYTGILIDGITTEVQNNLDLPVTSSAVYDYIDNLGLNPEDLADTKTKANTQSDWSEKDPLSAAYIRNKLVYDEKFLTDIDYLNSKPQASYPPPFGSETIFDTPCHYRLLGDCCSKTAIDIANNIQSFTFDGGYYDSKYFVVSGDSSCAIVKYKRYSTDNYPPFLVIKQSYYSSGEFDGFTVPSGTEAGIYGLCAIDDNSYLIRHVSYVNFKVFPHQLPTEYIPTDKEVTQGSTNLISSGAVYNALASIEDNLQFDIKPTLNSEKLVKSGGIATALNEKADKVSVSASVETLNTEINKKANQSDVATSINSLTTEINKKANQSDVTATIDSLNTSLTAEINKKADVDNVYSKNEIDGKFSGAFHYKGSVDSFDQLPATADVGDVYNVKNADVENDVKAGDNVVWCEVEGVGHWDALSGIVDLSAYWTGEEIQTGLNQIDENKANLNDLSKVALSNNYLDLDNKPCYRVGVEQLITGDPNYDSGIYYYYSLYYYTKRADYKINYTVEDYINAFKSISYGTINAGFTSYNRDSVIFTLEDNGILVISIPTVASPLALVAPSASLSYTLMGKKSITFAEAGIYCLVDITGNSSIKKSHVNELIFESAYKKLDLELMPEHSHKAADIEGMTNDYLDLANRPLVYSGIDQTISYDGQYGTNDLHAGQYYYIKCGEYIAKNIREYLEGYTALTYVTDVRPESYSTEIINKWHIENNGLLICENLVGLVAPYVIISPKDNLSYNIVVSLGGSTETITLTFSKGIYCLRDSVNGYVKSITFKSTYYPMDIRYLPAHQHTSSQVSDLQKVLAANKYILPAATTSTLGGVKVGENLSISEDGTISATSLDWNNVQNKPEIYNQNEIDTKLSIKQDKSNLVTTVNSISTDTQYPSAKLLYTTKTNLETSINAKVDKVTGSRLMTDTEGTKLAGIAEKANNYVLPAATKTSLGGVKVGANLSVSSDGTISATSLDWNNVQNKPETFTPSTHNHNDSYYTTTEINSKVSSLQTSINTKASQTALDTTNTNVSTNTTNIQVLNNKIGAANGIAKLNASGKLVDSELPANVQLADNLVTSISTASTNTQYPSAKVLYDTKTALENGINTAKSELTNTINSTKVALETSCQSKANLVTTINENSTDDQYPSAKLLFDIVGNYEILLNEINNLIGE